MDAHLWYFRYPLINPKQIQNSKFKIQNYIIVATTRPETMLGDEAVAVNPKDKRYKKLIGQKILLPLQNKEIPIIADAAVEISFGTGAVKVTPAHDPVDYEVGLRHKLPLTQVIGADGVMTKGAGDDYAGLDRFECRKKVVADLEELDLLEKTENYKHNVGFSQRADVPVEPMLSEQWFLKYPSVKKALKAVKDGRIKFWPPRWAKVYFHWLENIRDWCISRQLWWGHRIPAWYCNSCVGALVRSCIVSIERPARCPHCGGTVFIQDPDVLDTWFSSWLWPFATMGWPEKTPELKKFYPTSDLVTGPDIIFFWVARMIMAGYEFMNERPFDNVYFTGIIRDAQGRKMSKSLGNSPDPLDLIDKYGADGLRFGLMLVAPKGQDILFSEDRIEVGRNFMNKLWNASRFVMMNVSPSPSPLPQGERGKGEGLSLADKWILNRLQHTIRDVNRALDYYQFDTAARALYQFVWGEFCDWYLELSKVQKSEHVLLSVLDNILRLLHPYAPFITEEIWQKIRTTEGDGTITFASYPPAPSKIEHAAEADEMQKVMEIVTAIRNIRGEHNVSPSKTIKVILKTHNKKMEGILERDKNYIISLAKVSDLKITSGGETIQKAATAVAGGVDVFVPFEGLIDLDAEKIRLTKEIDRLDKYISATGQKLANKNFVERAPKEVVEKERSRLVETGDELEKLKKALKELNESPQ